MRIILVNNNDQVDYYDTNVIHHIYYLCDEDKSILSYKYCLLIDCING